MWMLLLVIAFSYNKYVCSVQPPTVHSKSGLIVGRQSEWARKFYSIPYAKPPTGPLRWAPPEEIDPWGSVPYYAVTPPPSCMQAVCKSNDAQCIPTMSEDCLFLNVFTPIKINGLLPVMVFIPGGAFMFSGASISLYESDHLVAAHNIVVVVIQYRLGILGFLANNYTSGCALSGNYGILDQQMAIKWVKSNIDAFGGDPNKITLFGESAGAQSVAIHYFTEYMQPYFQGAIIQSALLTVGFRTYNEYNSAFTAVCIRLLCQNSFTCDLACLRSKTAADIIAVQTTPGMGFRTKVVQVGERWLPVIDENVLDGQVFQMAVKRNFPLKPLIIGSNAEETIGMVYDMGATKSLSSISYIRTIASVFDSNAQKVLARYPPLKNFDHRIHLTEILTAWLITCPARILVRRVATYAYIFRFPVYTRNVINMSHCEGHPCHIYELSVLLQSMWRNFTSEEKNVAYYMANYWSNFATGQNPNTPREVPVKWPKITIRSENYLVINNPFSTTVDYQREECDFWDSIGYLL